MPRLVPPSPVFALATQGDTLWAGGVGGLASWPLSKGEKAEWKQEVGTLPLSSISVLLAHDSLLLAGGSEGIARSYTHGTNWQLARLEDGVASITAFAASPQFTSDSTMIAATLANGILRTTDGGYTWKNASFGLESMEVTALTWDEDMGLLAATSDGIYRSRDAGRAWRCIYAEEDLEIEALLALADQTWLAASASRGLLRSHDDGKSWDNVQGLNAMQALSLFRTPAGTLLLSTVEHGLLRSTDGGEHWNSASFLIVSVYKYAQEAIITGTDRGISISYDEGTSWKELPPPPTSDLQTLLIADNLPLVSGKHSGILQEKAGAWKRKENILLPITASTIAGESTLLLSNPEGLHSISLHEQPPRTLLKGEDGQVTHLTSHRQNLWAIHIDNQHLLRSEDSGQTWRKLPLPFGTAPTVAFRAISDRLLAATYDPLQYRVQVWYSTDRGESWTRSLEASTSWPIVATCTSPAALSIGNVLFLEQKNNTWQQTTVGDENSGIRRILGLQLKGKTLLFILTTTGLLRSDDQGENWQKASIDIPGEQIIDIAGHHTSLTFLLSGGRVWQWNLQEEETMAGQPA